VATTDRARLPAAAGLTDCSLNQAGQAFRFVRIRSAERSSLRVKRVVDADNPALAIRAEARASQSLVVWGNQARSPGGRWDVVHSRIAAAGWKQHLPAGLTAHFRAHKPQEPGSPGAALGLIACSLLRAQAAEIELPVQTSAAAQT
jgi:hypothetical protein